MSFCQYSHLCKECHSQSVKYPSSLKSKSLCASDSLPPSHTPRSSPTIIVLYYFKLPNNEVIPDNIFNSFAHHYICKVNLLHFSQTVHTLLINIIPLNKYSYISLLVVNRYWIVFNFLLS